MSRTVVIDCFAESLERYREGWAVIGVDVLRATTTAVTAAALGRRVFPVPDLERAVATAALLPGALLAGELGGRVPYGFEENNSPAALDVRPDVHRPMVLLSSSGTRLVHELGPRDAVYAACLRNVSAMVAHAAARHERVAVVGAGTRGEFREEDQLGCAWIAQGLVEQGFQAQQWTARIIERWRGAPVDAVARGASADYLRRSGQVSDLEFVLDHVDDLHEAYALRDGELVVPEVPARPTELPTPGEAAAH